MIIIKVMGGLGNQMFQYAFGEALKRIEHFDVKYDISYFSDIPEGDTPRMSYDQLLNQSQDIATEEEIQLLLKKDKALRNRIKKILHCYKSNVLTEADEIVDESYLNGYWQQESYFKGIESVIRKKYDFSQYVLSEKAVNVLSMIQNAKYSASIHVRGGDYLSDTNSSIFGGVCSEAYYKKACDYVLKQNPNVTFFMFSNDTAWAKEILHIPEENVVVVSDLLGQEEEWVELYLMSCCRSNIIANSSYSWWAAWLNTNEDKTVLSPSRWKNSDGESKIICKDWIRIDA